MRARAWQSLTWTALPATGIGLPGGLEDGSVDVHEGATARTPPPDATTDPDGLHAVTLVARTTHRNPDAEIMGRFSGAGAWRRRSPHPRRPGSPPPVRAAPRAGSRPS